MRVLTLTNMYPPHHFGGYELSCFDVMRRWQRRGHEVAVLTTDLHVDGVDLRPDEEPDVWRDLQFYWHDHKLVSPPLWRRAAMERRNRRALGAALRRFRPDVVSVWNMGAMSLGLLSDLQQRGLPLVLCVCDDWLVHGPDMDAWMRLFRRRRWAGNLVTLATRLPTALPSLDGATYCFVSEHIRTRAIEDGWPEIATSTVVYSGIDRTDFPRTPQRPREWGWRLLYVGRVDPRKGVETLLRALRLLPAEATLEMLGSGDADYEAHLRSLVSELGLDERVSIGAVDRPRLRERYEAADAVVFPSEWDEPFGLVPVEAMACGTPVVATGTGGSAEFLVDGRNCVLYAAGDSEALARALRSLAEDPRLRDRVCEGGLATASELDVDVLAHVLERWHLAAAEGFRAGRPADRPLVAQRVGPGEADGEP